jgi:uncharacterized protein (DUF3820 family)
MAMSEDPESGAKSAEPGTSRPDTPAPDTEMLVEIARMRMPFGRYAGTRLIDLPEPYVVWFRNRGFPRGRLGQLLATLYEVKANGLEGMLAPLREPDDPRHRPVPEIGDPSAPVDSVGDRARRRRRDGRVPE